MSLTVLIASDVVKILTSKTKIQISFKLQDRNRVFFKQFDFETWKFEAASKTRYLKICRICQNFPWISQKNFNDTLEP